MNEPTVGQFCWNELATSDIHRTKDFYSKLLGWQFKDIQSGDMHYTLVQANDKDLAGIWQSPRQHFGKRERGQRN